MNGLGDKARLVAWVAFLIVVCVSGTFLYVKWWRRGVPDHEYAAALCRQNYAKARTATDSQVVDAQRPITSRLQANRALMCRQMRRTGMLR